MKWFSCVLGMALLLLAGNAGVVAAGMTKCEMTFDLKGWSAIYKTQHGQGKITCDNGQSADVEIKTKGGGLTVGKTEMTGARGKFTEVRRLDELFGAYATGSAHAGASKSAQAMVVTKGNITFTFSGTGRGFDLGVDAGRLVIQPKGAKKGNKK